eukprot:823301-Pelagomonas_calceolata.AAC.1
MPRTDAVRKLDHITPQSCTSGGMCPMATLDFTNVAVLMAVSDFAGLASPEGRFGWRGSKATTVPKVCARHGRVKHPVCPALLRILSCT